MKKKTNKTEEVKQEVAENEIVSVTDIESPSGTVGAILKKARGKKDIQKIANTLKIRARYLQALEQSRYEDFPGKIYAIGFLRNYAGFLGLDVEALTAQYHAETSFIKPDTLDMPVSSRPVLFPSMKYLALALGVILLLCIFWYFLTYSETQTEDISAVTLEDTLDTEQVSEPVVTAPVVEEALPVVEAKKEAKAAPVAAPKGAVRIVALEEVWVEIEQDDTLILSRTLKKGETYDVPASETELFLKTGNAGGMEIYVDGQKVKSLGPVGAVRSGISLSADKLKNR